MKQQTVERLQHICPFQIHANAKLLLAGVIQSSRDGSYGLICQVQNPDGESHQAVVRCEETYYLAAKGLLEFLESSTGVQSQMHPNRYGLLH